MYLKMMNDDNSSIKKIGDEINKTFIDVDKFTEKEFNVFLENQNKNNCKVLLLDNPFRNKVLKEGVKLILLESGDKKYLISKKYAIYDNVYLLDNEGQTIERLI